MIGFDASQTERSSVPKPKPSPNRGTPAPAAAERSLPELLSQLFLWALVLVPPLLVWTTAKDSFRLPKLMAASFFALGSLLGAAWSLGRVPKVALKDLWAVPALRALLPLLAVATLGLATTAHPLHVREGLTELWIGALCLVAWSLWLRPARLEWLFTLMVAPAGLLALFAAVQFHHLWQPFHFAGDQFHGRLAVTSLVGNPADLGAFWVIPALWLQHSILEHRRFRAPKIALLALGLYAIVITQSFTAIAALAAGSFVFWFLVLPRRQALSLTAAGCLGLLLATAAVGPLRVRVVEKLEAIKNRDVNRLLTGRLDGWRAALHMFEEHPLIGVGHGAFRAAFAPTRLALVQEGVHFLHTQENPIFANAHNEYLEVAAEEGLLGLAALAWALWVFSGELRRLARAAGLASRFSLALGGAVALAVLALAFFPFRAAITAFPALLFLAWILSLARRGEEAAP